MINKKTVLKIFAMLAASVMMLCACGAEEKETPNDVSAGPTSADTDANIPDNIVPPITQGDPAVTSAPDQGEPSASSSDDAAVTDESKATSPTETKRDPDETEHLDEGLNTRAAEYLMLLNSSRVHTRFVEVSSFDGENMSSTEMEIFIDGSSRIYISDNNKIIIRDGTVTNVDYNDGVYFTYPDDGDYGLTFGYDISLYTLLSTEDTADGYSEIYSIAGKSITSTWTFGSDGSIRVADRSLDSSYFNLYNIKVIESSVSGMDFSIPDGYVEIDPEESDFFM